MFLLGRKQVVHVENKEIVTSLLINVCFFSIKEGDINCVSLVLNNTLSKQIKYEEKQNGSLQ